MKLGARILRCLDEQVVHEGLMCLRLGVDGGPGLAEVLLYTVDPS